MEDQQRHKAPIKDTRTEQIHAFMEDLPLMAVRYSRQHRLTYVNRPVVAFFGGTAEDYIDRDFLEFINVPAPSVFLSRLNALTVENPVLEFEQSLEANGGKEKSIRWITRVLFDDVGHRLEYQAIGEDVTLRKETERQLKRAREDALRASRAKSDFLASMSHEIRTPLNGIIGMAEYLGTLDLPPTHAQCLSLINQSGQMLLELINDILDFSKIEAGRMILDPQKTDLSRELDLLHNLLRERATNKAISLALDLDLPSRFHYTDITRLKQVLLNLIGNAIKFTHRGGEIRVRARELPADRLEFKVCDNGIGISREKMTHLFEPFVQGDGAVSSKHEGTGLGLSICKRIVEQMGGGISVESTEGEGSCFTFTILTAPPGETPLESLPGPARKSRSDTSSIKALLIEDDRNSGTVLRKLLQQAHVDARLVQSAEDGLALLNQSRFDLVFLDLNLPGINGLEFAGNIRQGRMGAIRSDLYFVAYTASATTSVQQQCREAAFDDFLAKPITASSLEEVISRYRTRSRQKR